MFRRILVAVDITHPDVSEKTLMAAAELARLTDAELRLVYVRYMIERAMDYVPAEVFRTEEESARASLMEMARKTGLAEDRISVVTPIGSAHHQVLAASEAFKADLIVTGPHSPSMAKYLLGMDAARIVQHAPISVLVVR